MEPTAPTAVDPLLVRQKEMYDRGETDELPVVEGMLAAPPVPPGAPVGGPAAEGQIDPNEQPVMDPNQQGVDPAHVDPHVPREEVIQTNENEGEYHAR